MLPLQCALLLCRERVWSLAAVGFCPNAVPAGINRTCDDVASQLLTHSSPAEGESWAFVHFPDTGGAAHTAAGAWVCLDPRFLDSGSVLLRVSAERVVRAKGRSDLTFLSSSDSPLCSFVLYFIVYGGGPG